MKMFGLTCKYCVYTDLLVVRGYQLSQMCLKFEKVNINNIQMRFECACVYETISCFINTCEDSYTYNELKNLHYKFIICIQRLNLYI